DVIELGRILPACAAGDTVKVPGEQGAITVLFRNTKEPGSVFYLITCSHVVRGILGPPPIHAVTVPRKPGLVPFASVVKNSTASPSRLPSDLALARLAAGALPQPSLAMKSGGQVSGFLPASQLAAGVQLQCEFPASHTLQGKVASSRMSLPIDFPGARITYDNLFMLN